jgi:ATP-dependent DNA ligase
MRCVKPGFPQRALLKRLPTTSFPGFIEPCHPIERHRPPKVSIWVHEIKSDGYRAEPHLRDATCAGSRSRAKNSQQD